MWIALPSRYHLLHRATPRADVCAQGNVVEVAAISTGHPLRALSLVWPHHGQPVTSRLGSMGPPGGPQGPREVCALWRGSALCTQK
jgi:hypothetical protein